jgi:large repetitive protein
MKIFTKCIPAGLFILLAILFVQAVKGQSVINPADTVYTYSSSAAAGTRTNPTAPALGTIGKWIRTVRMSWNTSEWKCYYYNGMPFRVHFPLGYNPTANDGKKYPVLIFYHGAGEAGPVTDNEISMAHGGQVPFQSASDAGTWPGYIIIPQNQNGAWDPGAINFMKTIIDYMITNNKVDGFHVVCNGLSAGGAACWDQIVQWPQVTAACLPMSSNQQSNANSTTLALTKFTPLWTTQGGLDTWPDPNDATIVNAAEVAAGADWAYTFYPTLGHDTWDNCWIEPNFWPFMVNAYQANPWPLRGQSAYCPGVNIVDTLGLAPQFDAYQWRMNGNLISGATTNTYIAKALGTYDARVERNGIWSDWSHIPVTITIRQPTVTPPITTSGLESFVIPSLSQSNIVLQMPTGYASYTWQKVGSNTTIGSANTLTVTSPGKYIAEVTQTGGCSSSFGAPFTVVGAPGTNLPSPASGVSASALSQTSVLINWSQNPSPQFNEVNFEVYQGTKSGGPYQLVGITGPDASKDTLTGLTSATKYYYVIRAVDSTGASTTSNEVSVTTIADVQPPTAPVALNVTGSTYNSISLNWSASTDNVGVVAYDIYINGAKSYTVGPAATSFTVYSLVNGHNYAFVVKARDLAGNVSSPSNQVSGEALLNGIPYNYYNGISNTQNVVPNFSTMTPAFSGSLPNISLSPQIDNTGFGFLFQGFINVPVTGKYTFQLGSDDGSNMWLGPLNGTTSPYVFGSTPTIANDGIHGTVNVNSKVLTLTAGIYPIAIAYLQQGGGYTLNLNWETPGTTTFVAVPNSAFQQTPVVLGTAPAYPTNLTATAKSYKSIGLTWVDHSTNETGFEIYRSTSANGTYAIVTTVPANSTSYTDTTCAAATTFYYKVQAVNQYGGSGYDPVQIGGVQYWYYNNYTASNLAFLTASLTPTSSGSLTNVALTPATQASNFAFKFLGYLNITTAGTYTFYTASDDGSDMYVGGFDSAHLVVKNDALQGTTTKSGTVSLSVGKVAVYTTYFQQGGGSVLQVYYKGPGITSQTLIPDAAWNATSTANSATTLALPKVPTLPTNLTVTATSASAISISWQDTATNVTNFQLFRSSNGDQSFVLLATLPSNVFSYSDTALFSNAKYYYKVEATNVGGSSPFTPEASATTLDIAPVMNKIANQQARYGTTTVIPVSATVSGGGAITLSASGLPAFATFTDNGNATGKITLNPAKTDSGTYNGLTVRAADGFGGNSSSSFSLWVNNNFAPTLNAISNVSMNEGDSVTVALVGQDQNPADTLTYTITNFPTNYGSSYTVTQNVSGTGSLVLKPSYAAAGTYSVVVVLNDKNGLSASQTFTVTVAAKNPNQTIYARIQATSALGAPWNNMTSGVITNMKDASGNATAVGINLGTTFWDPQPLGPSTGNNSGVYPDAVLNQFWYFGLYGGPANPVMTISGLNPSLKYNVTLFAASNFSAVPNNGTTTYASGSQTVSLNVQGNTQNTVTLDTLTPTAGGSIAVTMGRLGTSYPGYLNAVVVQSNLNDGTSPAPPNTLQATAVSGGVGLTWNDLAYNANSYKVYRSVANTSSFTLLATLASNAVSYTDTTTTGTTQYYYTVDATNSVGASPFSDTAAIITADKVPQIAAIANVTVSNTQSVQVNVSAKDDPTDKVTLTASGLPSFASFVDNGNGTGVISIAPTPGLQGSYNGITVTATDLSDSSRSTSFNINVVDTSITYTYLSFTENPSLNPSPWNSMLIPYIPFAGFSASNLLNQSGVNTGITVTLTDAWDGMSLGGEKRRNGSDLYPESVSNYAVYTNNANNHRMTVTGLDPTKAYNFQFYASYNTSQSCLTHITINGDTVSLNGSHNSNKTVQVNGITTSNGTVVINFAKDAAAFAAVVNAIVIEAYNPATTVIFSPGDLRKLDYSKTGTIALQWQDRATNETGYEVWRAPDGGSYVKLATLAAGSTSYVDNNIAPSTTYDYTVRTLKGTAHSAFSNPVKGYTYDNAVFLFMNRTWTSSMPHASAPAPFNNLNWNYPSVPNVWYNFTDENGLPTNIGASQPDAWDEVECCGAGTGNNSGVFPDAAMNQDWLNFQGDSSWVIYTGLDVAKTYDITVFASVTDDNTGNASTKYTITGSGTQQGVLNAHLNTSGTLTFFGVQPDGGGNVTIGVRAYDSSNSSFGTLGVVVIKGYTPSTGTITQPPIGTQETTTGLEGTATSFVNQDSVIVKPLTAYPNPFDQSFNLSVPATEGDKILVSVMDVTGRVLYQKEFENLYQGDNTILIAPNTSLAKGFYFVSVLYMNKNERQLIKMIKK